MVSIKMTEKSQSRGALEIGRAPRHSQRNFLVQKREPNLRGAQLAAQVNTGVEEDTGTDMLMFICHTMKTNCNYRSVVCGVFRGSWGGGDDNNHHQSILSNITWHLAHDIYHIHT